MNKFNFFLIPLTDTDKARLGIAERFPQGQLGVLLPISRVCEGIKRWEKKGCPSLDKHHESENSLFILEASVIERAAREEVLLNEFEEKYGELTTDKDTEAEKQASTYERRLQLKDAQIKKLNDHFLNEKETVKAYKLDFGETRSHRLNFLQRLVGRLFRIFSKPSETNL